MERSMAAGMLRSSIPASHRGATVLRASGGPSILKELSDRGHTVTAIARNPEKIASLPKTTAKKGDVWRKDELAELLRGHDHSVLRADRSLRWMKDMDRRVGSLSGAIGTTPEQLKKAKSLKGAIMPDGSIHP